jgi:hypothetical protein
MVPTAADSDQVTELFVVPVTVGVNVLDCPALRETALGVRVIPTVAGGAGAGLDVVGVGVNEIVALACAEGFEALMAVKVTVTGELI